MTSAQQDRALGRPRPLARALAGLLGLACCQPTMVDTGFRAHPALYRCIREAWGVRPLRVAQVPRPAHKNNERLFLEARFHSPTSHGPRKNAYLKIGRRHVFTAVCTFVTARAPWEVDPQTLRLLRRRGHGLCETGRPFTRSCCRVRIHVSRRAANSWATLALLDRPNPGVAQGARGLDA
jgi:hypothetical protein